jgi:CRP-like cAMP-binding protein
MTGQQIQILRQSQVFSSLEPRLIEQVLEKRIYQIRRFTKNSMIAQSGSPCNHAMIILEGSVSGEMMDVSGRILKIEDMEAPKMIAPAFLYGNQRSYPVNVIAGSDVLMWQMHRDEFSKLLQSELQLLDNYLNAISGRAQFLSEKIRFLSFPTLRSKLAFFIIRHSGGKEEFKMPLTHQQLSELFGVARPSISREIRLMNLGGFIESHRDMIRIPNRQKLLDLLTEK